MVISTSGYYSTGSSAVYALLSEYTSCTQGRLENWQVKGIDYEHAVLYTPDGLFDLEDKLLIGNSIHRSDEAIRSFREEMRRLYQNNYFWIGSFSKLLGDTFSSTVDEFIESICLYKVPGHWEYHYGYNKFNMRKFLGSIKRIILNKEIIGDFSKMPSFKMNPVVYYSFVKPEVFYECARKFINEYFQLVRGTAKEETLILNHFLLPHNCFRIPNYFDEDFRVIIVDRDPRDVFVMEKYRTRTDHSLLPCDDVKEFVSFWEALRESEKRIEDDRIIRVQFEDLIYKYDETIAYIEKSCRLNPKEHKNKRKIFSPERSMNNTQLFTTDTVWYDEVQYIEKKLSNYLYCFPEGSNELINTSRKQLGIVI